jgi:hypothetical protein
VPRALALMQLMMKQTPARRRFKQMAGGTNHFLITILIGLDAVRVGKAQRGANFSTSWAPHDIVRSADRSGEFAIKALMSWLVDALDSYTVALGRKPFLLQTASDRDALGGLGRSVSARVEWVANRLGLYAEESYLLSAVAIVWRNRLVHSDSENTPDPAIERLMLERAGEIARDYRGLDVLALLTDLGCGRAPRFKEATAMVSSVQRFVELADGEILRMLDLEKFFHEVLERYVADDPPRRIANVWGKDTRRKMNSLRQLAIQHGIGESEETCEPVLAEEVLEAFERLSPKEARLMLAARVPDPASSSDQYS